MKYYFRLLIVLFGGFLLFNSCGDETSPEVKSTVYQLPGCHNNSLSKTFDSQFDSCFSYSFTDKLEINFCVPGNCCPDKDRYFISSNIIRDSIFVTVKDTAKNLCKCMCNYHILGEYESLPLDKYYVKCFSNNGNESKILYSEIVKR